MPQAYINEIATKQTSVGPMHDLVLSNGERLGMGKFPPKGFAAGDYVNYDVVMRGQYKNLAPGSLSKATPPAGVAAPSSKPSYSAPSGDKRQEIISKQAALNSALTFANLLVAADALPFPKTKKASEKADLMTEIVQHYTAQFYKQATGEDFGEFETPADVMGVAEAGDGNWDE